MRPEDWEPGRYQWDRSFVWNLFFYKSVDYARFTQSGETDMISSVLQIRLLLWMLVWVLIALVALIGFNAYLGV